LKKSPFAATLKKTDKENDGQSPAWRPKKKNKEAQRLAELRWQQAN